jgi:hypothetical protein
MPVYSLARAATEAGRSRSTLLAAIRSGRLSATRDPANGAWTIDASELARAFPLNGDRHGDRHGGTAGDDRVDSAALLAAKDALIAEQRATIDDLRQQRDREAEERRRLTMVLADMRAATTAPVVPATNGRRSWLPWRR